MNTFLAKLFKVFIISFLYCIYYIKNIIVINLYFLTLMNNTKIYLCNCNFFYCNVHINTHTYSIYFENIYMYVHVYIYIHLIYIIFNI